MSGATIEEALAQVLEDIAAGRSLDESLAGFPSLREELEPLVRLAARLSSASAVEPSANFRSRSPARLKARIAAPRRPAWLRASRVGEPRPAIRLFPGRTVLRPAWVLLSALLLAVLGTTGLGVAYAADRSVPGDFLYVVDRAVETLQLSQTTSPAARAELAMAHAAERLAEVQELMAAGASMEHVGVALDGYGVSIGRAAQEFALMAEEGDQARTQDLSALLAAALSVHDQVLSDVRADIPSQAQAPIDGAIQASQAGRKTVNDLLAGGPPGSGAGEPGGGPPPGVPGGPPEGTPPGPPAGIAPGSASPPDASSGEATQFEIRVAGLEARLASVRNSLNKGDLEAGRGGLLAIEQEVNSLSLELAAIASENPARAQALARVLDEALSINEQALGQLIPQVPTEATSWVEAALAASHAGRLAAQKVLGEGYAPGPPGGSPVGPPGNPGP